MLEGLYANYFNILHKTSEFMPYFDQYYPENEEAELYAHIIASSPDATR